MTRLLKKLFIPHKHNHFRPHILRRRTVLFLAVFIFFLEGIFLVAFFLVIPESQLFSDILPLALVSFTNASRQENNLSALTTNALLEKAAQLKANDMAAKGYFSHTTPDGKDPWYWIGLAGYKYDFAGENLAVNFSDSKDVVQAWMASPSHKANILAGYYTEIGIASQSGLYQGKEAIFVVQFFGKPSSAKVSETLSQKVPDTFSSSNVVSQPTEKATEKVSGTISQKVPDTFNPATTTIAGEQADPPRQIENNVVSGTLPKKVPDTITLSFLEKAASTPRSFLNIIYFVLAGMVLLALVLKIFVKIRVQHPPLIFNGVILLFILISVIYINHFLSQFGLV